MDYRKENLRVLTDFFRSGCKNTQRLGVELEHFLVHGDSLRSLEYAEVERVLEAMQPKYGERVMSQGHLIGIERDGAGITLEPAAQFEISMGPCRRLEELERRYDFMRAQLDAVLEPMGAKVMEVGYHPRSRVDELPLIPKRRYEFMDAYFKQTGSHGKNMMKGSAATQVSIDYRDEADFKKKFRVACALGPLFAFITDNTSVYEGAPYEGRMARTAIWNDVDPDRSMLPRGALDGDFGFEQYAEYIYDSPCILIEQGGEAVFTGAEPVASIFAGRQLTRADAQHICSMFFPDVRLKTYIEIRMCDSMPIEYVLAFAALTRDVFYNSDNLDRLYEATASVTNADVAAAKSALMKNGFAAEVYGRSAADWLRELAGMVKGEYFATLGELISEKTTLRERIRVRV